MPIDQRWVRIMSGPTGRVGLGRRSPVPSEHSRVYANNCSRERFHQSIALRKPSLAPATINEYSARDLALGLAGFWRRLFLGYRGLRQPIHRTIGNRKGFDRAKVWSGCIGRERLAG